jgi:hypothetical protein
MQEASEFLNVKDASSWATKHLGKKVSPSNIAYLITYGRVKKRGENGNIVVAKRDLVDYYKSYKREDDWKKQLGDDLNWTLSFEQYNESQTTKHVHGLLRTRGSLFHSLLSISLMKKQVNLKQRLFSKRATLYLTRFVEAERRLFRRMS